MKIFIMVAINIFSILCFSMVFAQKNLNPEAQIKAKAPLSKDAPADENELIEESGRAENIREEKTDSLDVTKWKYIYYANNEPVAFETFDSEGNSKIKGKVPDGPVIVYDQEGRLLRELNYRNNLRDGLQKTYYADGTVSHEQNFKLGIPHGVFKVYYQGGILYRAENYQAGKPHGKAETFYRNGQLKDEAIFENGKLNGESKFYLENGQLTETVLYKNGDRTKRTKYNAKGKIISEE